MSQPALKVLYRLRSNGFMAFLVGGALRDLYRHRVPRDFDVATNASIEEIRSLFRNSRTIGKRFPIVHTYFGNDLIEISSIKADSDENLSKYELVEADAKRRDFTVNSIYYDINDFQVIDPLGGLEHLETNKVIPIGEMDLAFEDDPVRMLRALKLVSKLGFELTDELKDGIHRHAGRWEDVGPGRRYEEMSRVLLASEGASLLMLCSEFGLLEHMWPSVVGYLKTRGAGFVHKISSTIRREFVRGSYVRETHMQLWLRLFLETDSSREPTEDRKVTEARFEAFMGGMAMPFRQPVIDALHHIDLMLMGHTKRRRHGQLSREANALVRNYLEHCNPDLAEIHEGMTKPPKKRSRRRPPRRRRKRRSGMTTRDN